VIGPTVARELARQRELAIMREVERARAPRSSRAFDLLPTMSLAAAALLLAALGAPLP
jgi:hypothetical protein